MQIRELARQFGQFKDSYEDMNFTPPLLRTIKAQTLIVYGDRDEFFPVSIPVEMYRAIRLGTLDYHTWSHVPTFGTHACEFQEVVLPFLRGKRAW